MAASSEESKVSSAPIAVTKDVPLTAETQAAIDAGTERYKVVHIDNPVLEITNAPPIYEDEAALKSRFGDFGGRFIPETLMRAHEQLETLYVEASKDPKFREEFETLGRDYIGR